MKLSDAYIRTYWTDSKEKLKQQIDSIKQTMRTEQDYQIRASLAKAGLELNRQLLKR